MDKNYNHTDSEQRIYAIWEKKGYFAPEIHPTGKPYCIILPPPNANGALHFGHAMFTVEDILIRYHRMKGYATLWLPGTDHAGLETQFVYEKKLKEEGKSRFDFSREDLYQQIWEYVQENRGGIEDQLKRLGFSLDWSREKFTLDPEIVTLVTKTFKDMYKDGLVYRDYRLVNYCTFDGTSLSDLEVTHEERNNPLYYIKYGPLVLATTRPETKFGDTAVAVHPSDKRYKQYVGKKLAIETVLGKATIQVVADESVDPEFGTGVVKITPAHDFNDFEVAQRHNLPLKQVIGFDGKLNEHAGKFAGLYIKEARRAIVQEMQQKGLIEKIDEKYQHRIALCYKCRNVLEPLPLEQWFVKVVPLAEKAVNAIDTKDIAFFPEAFLPLIKQWYAHLRDWNISRQSVWGIRIPVWYEVDDQAQFTVTFLDKNGKMQFGILEQLLKATFSWEEIINGLQRVMAVKGVKVVFEEDKRATKRYLPETDTFDTWFSSGQWPVVTLKTSKVGDFEKFYPTSVMETGRDILFFWVSRMIMLGIYMNKGEIAKSKPFKHVVLHGLVNDPYGKKMSKSKGNVVNPLELVDQYGADAVRFALVYGNATGNDQILSYPKLEAARKFTNKLWNIGRFIEMNRVEIRGEGEWMTLTSLRKGSLEDSDREWIEKTEKFSAEISGHLDRYQFNLAAERLYEFIWHEFADVYIEEVKNRLDAHSFAVLEGLYICLLQLLHPFMPFVTEEIYQKIPGHTESIMITSWPTT